MRYGREKIVDANEKSPKAAGPVMDTEVLLAHSRIFFVDTRVRVQHTKVAGVHNGSADVHTRNPVLHTAVAGVHNEGAAQHAQDLVVDTDERVLHAKHPRVQNEDLRVDKQACVQDNDVLVQDDQAAPELRENRFLLQFSLDSSGQSVTLDE